MAFRFSIVVAFFCACMGSAVDSRAATPATAPAARPGTRTAADARKVEDFVTKWAKAPEADRDGGEVALQTAIPTDAFPLLEAAANRPDLTPSARAWLKTVIERERPWEAARSKITARHMIYNEWNLRTGIECYEKYGQKNAKWDETAREAILQFFAYSPNHKKSFELLGQSMKQGCEDPFIAYLYARDFELFGNDPVAADRLYYAACDGMMKSKYPPTRKALASLRRFEYHTELGLKIMGGGKPLPPGFADNMGMMNKEYMDLWEDVVVEPGVPERQLEMMATRMVLIEIPPEADRKRYFDYVHGLLEKTLPKSAAPFLVKGKFYIKYAWDARGADWGFKVTPEGARLFVQRLTEAQAALEKAWEIDPSNSEVAEAMITVAMGLQWPREKMDVWFQRAMAADPDNQSACGKKLLFLEPKWGGSPEEMIKFGHECLETRNWSGKIPFQLVEVHYRLASLAPNEVAYWQIPAVWEDVQSVYVPYLKGQPELTATRSQYCYLACRTGHWQEAAAQFKLLGKDAAPAAFGGKAAMEGYRHKAMEKAQEHS